jgi:two-component sensor histidine kinase
MKFEDFTQEERTTIAEFVYSYDSDILIKTDALDLVNVFVKKEFVDELHAEELRHKIKNNQLVLEEMIEILFTSVEEVEGKKIMNEYFGRSII